MTESQHPDPERSVQPVTPDHTLSPEKRVADEPEVVAPAVPGADASPFEPPEMENFLGSDDFPGERLDLSDEQ
jgi:hypothetical protein